MPADGPAPEPTASPVVALWTDGVTHAGEAVGRLADGKACFVPYALPGERVAVQVVDDRARWARARLVEVLEPSPDRVVPPCPYYGPDRCGGCQLQHASPERQADMKRRIVREQLARLGHLRDIEVAPTVRPPGGWPAGYRSSARFGVRGDGRLGFRQAGSHELVAVDVCLLLDGPTQAARAAAGDEWVGIEEVTVRTGTDGQSILGVRPGPDPVHAFPDSAAGLTLLGTGAPAVLRPPGTVTYRVGPVLLQVSAASFFQAGVAAATTLAELVTDLAGDIAGRQVLDLYAGVGLFSATLAHHGALVVAVESEPSAASDARANLAPFGDRATVHEARVEQALPRPAGTSPPDVVVVDPPRSGAGRHVTRRLAALGARTVLYVACDVASLARDARVLVGNGYRPRVAIPVDQFGHTARIEVVAAFDRTEPGTSTP